MGNNNVLILVPNYPTEGNPYANAFVHSRVKAYQQYGIDVCVFVLNRNTRPCDYSLDGISVLVGNEQRLLKILNEEIYSRVCVHFLNEEMIHVFDRCNHKLSLVIVVHGDEAIHWYQRIFPGELNNIRLLLGTIHGALIKPRRLHKIIKFLAATRHDIQFVAVSEWMKNMAEKTWRCEGVYKWNIIPNYINQELFVYNKKNEDDRYKFLSIRPFHNGKYGNDITAKLLLELSKEDYFSSIRMVWVGDGILYNKNVKPVVKMRNISFERHLLAQRDIPEYHKKSGIFICPTRQDAQGVSMCEAMSSGLVPITLYNTAIPEFLPDDDRLVCRNIMEMKQLVTSIIDSPEEYMELSEKCSSFIQEKCSFDNTILKEIELFNY